MIQLQTVLEKKSIKCWILTPSVRRLDDIFEREKYVTGAGFEPANIAEHPFS